MNLSAEGGVKEYQNRGKKEEVMSANEAVLTYKQEKRNQEDGDSVIWAGPKTKGRETVSHFSCAWSPFPPGRKHGDRFQCHRDQSFGLQFADIDINNLHKSVFT